MSVELRSRQSFHDRDHESHAEAQLPELKPVDRGRDAWTVLIAGFIFEAIFWGYPMCFGVYQKYYSELPEFQADSANIPLIGTLAQALYYLGAPLAALATKRFPRHQRHLIAAGWLLCTLSLALASCAATVRGLVGTQGFLYGLGFVTLSYPIVAMVNEWWVARKGMAFGLISAASGLTGAAMPFIMEALLARYGYRTALRASAVAMAILTFPLLFCFKGRLPVAQQQQQYGSATSLRRMANWGFLYRPLFWMYTVAVLVQGLGFFFPSVFLPSYAVSLNLSSTSGALLLSLMSIAQVLGQFAFGYLSDKNGLPVSVLAAICCIVAAAAALTLWGLAKSMALLIPFSLVYGFFGFGFGTMRVAMGRAVSGDDPSSVLPTYAIFVFLQGIGNILVGPLSAALISGSTMVERFAAGKYEGAVILTGTSSLCAALVIGLWHGGEGISKLHS